MPTGSLPASIGTRSHEDLEQCPLGHLGEIIEPREQTPRTLSPARQASLSGEHAPQGLVHSGKVTVDLPNDRSDWLGPLGYLVEIGGDCAELGIDAPKNERNTDQVGSEHQHGEPCADDRDYSG
jgi:hypothetical protein